MCFFKINKKENPHLHIWCGPKAGTTEGKHGTRVRGKKDILTKVTKESVRVSGAYYPVVSNIGSHTTNTPVDTTTLRVSSHIVI